MHLNENYEAIRGQSLLMDPLLTVSKACLMIERIEWQKQVTTGVTSAKEIAAIANRMNSINHSGIESNNAYSNAFAAKGAMTQKFKKDSRKLKNNSFYDHCQRA